MSRALDLTGVRFGRLVAVRRVPKPGGRNKWGITHGWECLCDCGTIKFTDTGVLRGGHAVSCGCLRRTPNRNRKFPPHEASLRAKACNIKGQAKERNKPWTISIEIATFLMKQRCFWCHEPPRTPYNSILNRGAYKQGGCRDGIWDRAYLEHPATVFYNGIDRLDNSEGYIFGNVVPCCATCNFAKHTMSYTDFIHWAERVVQRWVD